MGAEVLQPFSEFVADVSHELRTPLTAMLTWAGLLRTELEVRRERGQAPTMVLTGRSQEIALAKGAVRPLLPYCHWLLVFAAVAEAERAELMRLDRVDSETMRPPQTDARRSSLLTTRSRCWIK